MSKTTKNSGVILISVLWVVLILSLIVWGLSQRSALEVSVLETYRGKVRSWAAAQGGVSYVLSSLSRSPSIRDSLYAAGIALQAGAGGPPEKTPQDFFSHIDVGPDAYAVVQWSAEGFGNEQVSPFGLQDEQGKININAVNRDNYHVLSALFELKDLTRRQADALAMAVVNYKEESDGPPNDNWLTGTDQMGLKPKKKPYQSLYELLDLRGMTPELFDRVKSDLTVYGNIQSGLWVNINTANNDVLQAMANAASRDNPAYNAADIASKARGVRDGQDGRPFTADDGQDILAGDIQTWPQTLRQSKAEYLRAHVTGIDQSTGTRTSIDAVFHQDQIVAWQRE